MVRASCTVHVHIRNAILSIITSRLLAAVTLEIYTERTAHFMIICCRKYTTSSASSPSSLATAPSSLAALYHKSRCLMLTVIDVRTFKVKGNYIAEH